LVVGFLVESNHVSHIYPSEETPSCPVWWEVASEDDDRVKVLVSLVVTLDGPREIVSIVVSEARVILRVCLFEANKLWAVIVAALCSCLHLFLCTLGFAIGGGLLPEHMNLRGDR
jgi:hypothetical protein